MFFVPFNDGEAAGQAKAPPRRVGEKDAAKQSSNKAPPRDASSDRGPKLRSLASQSSFTREPQLENVGSTRSHPPDVGKDDIKGKCTSLAQRGSCACGFVLRVAAGRPNF